jgi:hypothetical protein
MTFGGTIVWRISFVDSSHLAPPVIGSTNAHRSAEPNRAVSATMHGDVHPVRLTARGLQPRFFLFGGSIKRSATSFADTSRVLAGPLEHNHSQRG